METVHVGEKFQIVITKEARRRAGIVQGDELIVTAEEGVVTLRKRPGNYTEYLRGLHKEVWAGVDPDKYIEELRSEWGESQVRKEA